MSRPIENGPGECPFCRILRGESSARFVLQDEQAAAFWDIHPVAPVHILVVPRVHVSSAAEVQDPNLWADLMALAARTARHLGLGSYRLVVNCGETAGQTIPHLHVHVLSGGQFSWPPGVGAGGSERGEAK